MMGSHCIIVAVAVVAVGIASHTDSEIFLSSIPTTLQKLVPPPQQQQQQSISRSTGTLSVSQKLQTASTFVVLRMADVAPEQQQVCVLFT